MTEELNDKLRGDPVKLARHFIEVRKGKGITAYGVLVLCEAILKMDAALTQRPAAQEVDERAAFEAWAKALPLPLDGHGGHYSNIRTRNNWMGWQARASLPAPQQATPEPVGGDDEQEQ